MWASAHGPRATGALENTPGPYWTGQRANTGHMAKVHGIPFAY